MAKTAAERMRDMRWRRKNGIVRIYKHQTVAERVRDHRARLNEEFKKEEAEKLKAYKRRTKIDVLKHYGNGVCACLQCGEDRIECLSIDHIHGNGNKHRKSLKRQGHLLYIWLKNNHFPDGFQTLCMNCQWVKRFKNKEYNHLRDNVTTVTKLTSVTCLTTVTPRY